MPYAAVLYPDHTTQVRIKGIFGELARCGISDHMLASHWLPHISLAVFDELDVQDAESKLCTLAADTPSFPMVLSSLGVFPGEENVLFLSPVVTDDLLRAHRRLHVMFGAYKDREWDYYLGGKWVPHCTLAERLPCSHIGRAMDVCARIPMPIRTQVTELGLVEFRPAKALCTYRLTDR